MLHRETCIPFTEEDVLAAIDTAAKGRMRRQEVMDVMRDKPLCSKTIIRHLKDGTWRKDLKYRDTERTNNNGKVRHINMPEFVTLVYEHLLKNKLEPIYSRRDPLVSLNCKAGCGITPPAHGGDRIKYVLPRMKHLYYDQREFQWGVSADQRKCYEHIKESVFRKELKRIVRDRWLIDFSVGVCFVNGHLPVGTPTSPLAHHILMLGFHEWLCRYTEWRVCYADNCLVACRTKEEAQQMKWRIRQYWWYELKIRAKRADTRVFPIGDSRGFDFCGYRVVRNAYKRTCDHNKGYCKVRKGILERARKCDNDASWSSYFGLMRHADCYSEMVKIERDMKLKELTKKIRVDRKMDAPNIKAIDLARSGQVFNIYDYEIRHSEKSGEPNWIKMLIGIQEHTDDGVLTGRMKAYEVHGSMMGIVSWMSEAEKEIGKERMLPIEDVVIIDQCGYIFADSTNQMEYINDEN